jgi:trk system potassium uptake protein TrkA
VNVVVIGYGRFGRLLIQELKESKINPFIIVVDRNEQALADLPFGFNGFALVRDASDLSLFEAVKIQAADVFFAVTDQPNVNFMLAHIAKELYKVPKVVLRVPFQEKRKSFDSFGLTTVNPLADAAQKTIDAII